MALAESCFTASLLMGAAIELNGDLRADALLFGESQSRIVISFSKDQSQEIETLARKAGVPFAVLGTTGGQDFQIRINQQEFINENILESENIWKNSLSRYGNRVA